MRMPVHSRAGVQPITLFVIGCFVLIVYCVGFMIFYSGSTPDLVASAELAGFQARYRQIQLDSTVNEVAQIMEANKTETLDELRETCGLSRPLLRPAVKTQRFHQRDGGESWFIDVYYDAV